MRLHYTNEEANAILQRAVELQPLGEVSREQLMSIAAEIGISEAAVKAAEEAWIADRREGQERAAFQRARYDSLRARLGFCFHLAAWMYFNMVFITESHGRTPFFLIPLIAWGQALVFHGIHAFYGSGRSHEKAFRRWRESRGVPVEPKPTDYAGWSDRPYRP